MLDSAVPLSNSLFDDRPRQSFETTTVSLAKLKEDVLRRFVAGVDEACVGVAATLKEQSRLASVVFATPSKTLHVIDVARGHARQLRLLETHVFQNLALRLVGAHMDVLAYGLYTDAGVLLSNGVDLLRAFSMRMQSDEPEGFLSFLDPQHRPNIAKVRDVFCGAFSAGDSVAKAVVRAREYAVAAQRLVLSRRIAAAMLVSTLDMERRILAVAAKIHRETMRLYAAKPLAQKNDVAKNASAGDGTVTFTCERYKTRIRATGRQKIVLHAVNGTTVEGHVREVQGRSAIIAVRGALPLGLKGVSTVGKDPLTAAEKSRELVLFHLLQRRIALVDNPAFVSIWFPSTSVPHPLSSETLAGSMESRLNASQRAAVRSVLDDAPPGEVGVQVVVGPPGTGKTTMIAASVQELSALKRPVWLVAQSNVAVKNIAQKLADVDFWDFKILVSHEFHFEWHEHIYEKIETKVLTSDDFPGSIVDVEKKLAGATVILCTLSLLSSERVQTCGFTRLVPVETLIVDEASQISLADYLAPVNVFGKTLRKLVFVGDDKQLAPYGSEDLTDMQSIFEVAVHRTRAIMLDTSYRLPVPICAFISKHMYVGKLAGEHPVKTRTACRFVDVYDGSEQKVGTSWKNEREADACIDVARQLFKSDKEFRIITPYDPQRAVIEKKLKVAELPWKDAVFCVDSFQGNEAPHIIVSVVRTTRPGFLRNARRTNVMLTRCTRGMYVCASKAFLETGIAQQTLVGKMAREWGPGGWLTMLDVLNGRV